MRLLKIIVRPFPFLCSYFWPQQHLWQSALRLIAYENKTSHNGKNVIKSNIHHASLCIFVNRETRLTKPCNWYTTYRTKSSVGLAGTVAVAACHRPLEIDWRKASEQINTCYESQHKKHEACSVFFSKSLPFSLGHLSTSFFPWSLSTPSEWMHEEGEPASLSRKTAQTYISK